jgi:hypothetical protein
LQQLNETHIDKKDKQIIKFKKILNDIVDYREEETGLNGLEVLERNYNIIQLEKCIIDSTNKSMLDENISNYKPVFSPFEFFAKLVKDGINSIKMNEDNFAEMCNLIKLRTNKLLESKFS